MALPVSPGGASRRWGRVVRYAYALLFRRPIRWEQSVGTRQGVLYGVEDPPEAGGARSYTLSEMRAGEAGASSSAPIAHKSQQGWPLKGATRHLAA